MRGCYAFACSDCTRHEVVIELEYCSFPLLNLGIRCWNGFHRRWCHILAAQGGWQGRGGGGKVRMKSKLRSRRHLEGQWGNGRQAGHCHRRFALKQRIGAECISLEGRGGRSGLDGYLNSALLTRSD